MGYKTEIEDDPFRPKVAQLSEMVEELWQAKGDVI